MSNHVLLAACAAALGLTSAGSAAALDITGAAILFSDQVGLSGNIVGYGPYNATLTAGEFVLQTDKGNVLAFCIDVFRPIAAGNGFFEPVSYVYTSGALTTDNSTGVGTGNALTLAQLKDIGGLIALGDGILISNGPDPLNQIPAIQGAIWHDEYGLTATFSSPAETAYYNAYIGMSFSGPIPNALLSTGDLQVLASVPEPAAWSTMILGLGGLGAMARRRRAAAA